MISGSFLILANFYLGTFFQESTLPRMAIPNTDLILQMVSKAFSLTYTVASPITTFRESTNDLMAFVFFLLTELIMNTSVYTLMLGALSTRFSLILSTMSSSGIHSSKAFNTLCASSTMVCFLSRSLNRTYL